MSLFDEVLIETNTTIKENDIPNELEKSGSKLGRFMLVDEVGETLGVSRRTIFTYLKEGKISGIKSRGVRLIYTGSVLGYLLKQKVIKVNDIKERELKEELRSQVKMELLSNRIRTERSQGKHLYYEL
jgi:excisionase family DNA binding protein